MHVLQPKHSKLKPQEVADLLAKYNINKVQLPKISKNDPILPENCNIGDVIKIERKEKDKVNIYYRLVV